MTYKKLAETINTLPPEQQAMEAKVWLEITEETLTVTELFPAREIDPLLEGEDDAQPLMDVKL